MDPLTLKAFQAARNFLTLFVTDTEPASLVIPEAFDAATFTETYDEASGAISAALANQGVATDQNPWCEGFPPDSEADPHRMWVGQSTDLRVWFIHYMPWRGEKRGVWALSGYAPTCDQAVMRKIITAEDKAFIIRHMLLPKCLSHDAHPSGAE